VHRTIPFVISLYEGYLKINGPLLLFIFHLALKTSRFAHDSQLDDFGLPTSAKFEMDDAGSVLQICVTAVVFCIFF